MLARKCLSLVQFSTPFFTKVGRKNFLPTFMVDVFRLFVLGRLCGCQTIHRLVGACYSLARCRLQRADICTQKNRFLSPKVVIVPGPKGLERGWWDRPTTALL